MLIYNINLFIAYIASFLSRYFNILKKNNIISNILMCITFLSLSIISGLRYNVGTDYNSYEYLFNTINNYDINNSEYEVGYILLNKIIRSISDNKQIIFIITSLIILFLIILTINRYSSKVEISIFLFITLYFYYSSFNVVRQYIAISIMFYGSKYIYDRNLKCYMICTIIALLFHTTAIVALPLYFLYDKRLNKKTLIGLIMASVIILILINPIFNIIIKIFPRYAYYEGGVLFQRGTYRSVIIQGSIFFLTYVYRKKIIKIDNKNNLYINAMCIAFILSILGLKSVLFIRFLTYFSIYSILLIPSFIDIFTSKLRPLIYLAIIVLGYTYCCLLLSINDGGILPYMFRIKS